MTPSMLKGLAEGLRNERMPGIAEQVECAAATVERLNARVEELEAGIGRHVQDAIDSKITPGQALTRIAALVVVSTPSPREEQK